MDVRLCGVLGTWKDVCEMAVAVQPHFFDLLALFSEQKDFDVYESFLGYFGRPNFNRRQAPIFFFHGNCCGQLFKLYGIKIIVTVK